MQDDDSKKVLAQSVRQLSTNLDAAALELRHGIAEDCVANLMEISVKLSNAADAMENPALLGKGINTSRKPPLQGRSSKVH